MHEKFAVYRIPEPNVPNNTGWGSLLYIRNDTNYKQLNFGEGSDIFNEFIYTEIKLNGMKNYYVHVCTEGENHQNRRIKAWYSN